MRGGQPNSVVAGRGCRPDPGLADGGIERWGSHDGRPIAVGVPQPPVRFAGGDDIRVSRFREPRSRRKPATC